MQSIPNNFWAWASRLSPDDATGMLAIVCGCAVAAIALISITVYKIHRTRAEHALKRELLDRGLGAQEIATIVNAKPSLWK
jgi:hypothetical protein